jgi:hypothetical protein
MVFNGIAEYNLKYNVYCEGFIKNLMQKLQIEAAMQPHGFIFTKGWIGSFFLRYFR